jgi:hypothetical protein
LVEEMDPEKLSIPEAAAVVIRRNYIINEAIRLRIVNYHALAARISPRIEELTGRKAKLPTIVVAIKRFSDRMEVARLTELEKILENAKVTLTGGMLEVTLESKGVERGRVLQELLNMVPKFSSIPDIVMFPEVVKVLAERDDGKLIKKEMGARYPTTVGETLARIGIHLGQGAERIPGVATFITELLYRNGVIVHLAYIGRPEILLIVDEKFGTRAYDVLRRATVAR